MGESICRRWSTPNTSRTQSYLVCTLCLCTNVFFMCLDPAQGGEAHSIIEQIRVLKHVPLVGQHCAPGARVCSSICTILHQFPTTSFLGLASKEASLPSSSDGIKCEPWTQKQNTLALYVPVPLPSLQQIAFSFISCGGNCMVGGKTVLRKTVWKVMDSCISALLYLNSPGGVGDIVVIMYINDKQYLQILFQPSHFHIFVSNVELCTSSMK